MWAQALDNESPDHVTVNGKEVNDDDDDALRQQAMSSLSSVVKDGKKVFSESHVILHVSKTAFLLEVPSNEKDVVGRIAPITYFEENKKMAANSAISGLQSFARKIGRTISDETIAIIRKAFLKVK